VTKTFEDWSGRTAPSLNDFERVARIALDSLPAEFLLRVGDVQLRIADFPERDVLIDLKARSEFEILGLFEGVGLAHDADMPDTGQLPNMVWLYRRPILDYWSEHDDTLGAIIRHVLMHEIGHHFGLSDDDMEAIEAAAEAAAR